MILPWLAPLVKRLVGGCSADQTASVHLQESLGFTRVAHFKEVGYKFGQWLDVIFLQLMLRKAK